MERGSGMERAVNRCFNYPKKELWEDSIWKERFSTLLPLAQRINAVNMAVSYTHLGKERGPPRKAKYYLVTDSA